MNKINKITLIGCYKGNRVKSGTLFTSLSKLNNGNNKTILNEEQIEGIKRLYEKRGIKYEHNSSMGGSFGMYFSVIIKWNGENMYMNNTSMFIDKCCYYFNAKTLLIKIVNEIVNEGISIKNMIYFNNGYKFGRITSNTIIFDTKCENEEQITNDINIFLQNIYNVCKLHFDKNELIIKWLIPKTYEYGFIKKTYKSKNNPCKYNQQNIMPNENFEKQFGSRQLNALKNKYIGTSNIELFINNIQEIYKNLINEEQIEKIEQLKNMIETVCKKSDILFNNIIKYNNKYKQIYRKCEIYAMDIIKKIKKILKNYNNITKNEILDSFELDENFEDTLYESFLHKCQVKMIQPLILEITYYEILENQEKYIELDKQILEELDKQYNETIKNINNNELVKKILNNS